VCRLNGERSKLLRCPTFGGLQSKVKRKYPELSATVRAADGTAESQKGRIALPDARANEKHEKRFDVVESAVPFQTPPRHHGPTAIDVQPMRGRRPCQQFWVGQSRRFAPPRWEMHECRNCTVKFNLRRFCSTLHYSSFTDVHHVS